MFIVKYKKIFISIAGIMVALSLGLYFVVGVNIGIDFRGGSITEVVYKNSSPSQDDVLESLSSLSLGGVLVQSTGVNGYLIKTRDVSDIEHNNMLFGLRTLGQVEEIGFNSIGPSVGSELTRKAFIAIALVSLSIILFIAFTFRKVSQPVSSWKYGLIAVVTLLHDIIIPLGVFTLLSHFYGVEMDTLFVVAMLTILGLSLSDTIVIFDRIRENLKIYANKLSFSEVVGKSVEQSYVRSINTSMTVILVLLALVFFGPLSTKYFAIMLTVGMFFGTYSSIFLASPLLVTIEEWQKRSK